MPAFYPTVSLVVGPNVFDRRFKTRSNVVAFYYLMHVILRVTIHVHIATTKIPVRIFVHVVARPDPPETLCS